ncbi:MAG: GTP-binding protein [Candidatus Lokiarchaeota archaeon]|nr:GTP-binding protein [Candidatus Lokiarchaeota archaeon]
MVKQILFKILTVGDGSVGKTTLLERYVEGLFKGDQKMTIGVNFYLKRIQIEDFDIALQLWDFGGQERFRFLLKKYVKVAAGALLLYDLTNPVTIERANEWIELVRMHNSNLPVILVGTKYDLVDPENINDDESNIALANFDLIANIKTSSKTGKNVEDVFNLLINNLLTKTTIIN